MDEHEKEVNDLEQELRHFYEETSSEFNLITDVFGVIEFGIQRDLSLKRFLNKISESKQNNRENYKYNARMQVTFKEILRKSKKVINSWREDEDKIILMHLKTDELDKLISQSQHYTTKLREEYENLENIRSYLLQHNEQMQQRLNASLHQLISEGATFCHQKGLTAARIHQFNHFLADESTVDSNCGICLEELKVGRRMVRLDCAGHHTFCQNCTEKWFHDHNTCPNCRYVFS